MRCATHQRRLLAIAVAGFLAAVATASSGSLIAPEYAIKAVFLSNFLRYAEWPAQSPQSGSSGPVVIAVLGDDPFGKSLDEAIRDRTVRGRPVVILRTGELKVVKSAHLAFIGISDPAGAAEAVRVLSALSVLTVGDTQVTARAGVVVNLVMTQGKVGFNINLNAARRSHIVLSSQLLKLAVRVMEQGK